VTSYWHKCLQPSFKEALAVEKIVDEHKKRLYGTNASGDSREPDGNRFVVHAAAIKVKHSSKSQHIEDRQEYSH
jgi:hypothetical protein